jgi:hypothetical protein
MRRWLVPALVVAALVLIVIGARRLWPQKAAPAKK